MSQNRKMGILILTILLISGSIYWIFWGNRTELIVHLEGPYTLSAEKSRQYQCVEKICTREFPHGTRIFCIKKDYFYSQCKTLTLPWGEETIWKPVLKKMPTIINIPKKQKKKNKNHASPPQQDQKEQSIFSFQEKTGELFFFDSEKKEKIFITKFFGIQKATLIPYGKDLFFITPSEAFFISTSEKKKKRILTEKNITAHVFPYRFALLSTDKMLYQFQRSSQTLHPLPFFTIFPHIAFCQEDTVFYATQSGSDISFFEYNFYSKMIKKIALANGKKEFRISCGENPNEIRILYTDGREKRLEF
jgi:hypothetical protein